MTNIFISWSGEISKEIAEELRSWIPSVLQFANPYFTPNDIEKGGKWSTEIATKLSETNVGIICLTKENLDKPWILFEAGALSKDIENSKVCSVLFGLENTDLAGPLTTFQTTEFDKVDFRKMMAAINDAGGDRKLSSETFDSVFNKWWPDLERKIQSILERDWDALPTNIREDRELLEEVLSLVREQSSMRPSFPNEIEEVPFGLLEEWLESCAQIVEHNRKPLSETVNEVISKQLRMLDYLFDKKQRVPISLKKQLAELMKETSEFIPF